MNYFAMIINNIEALVRRTVPSLICAAASLLIVPRAHSADAQPETKAPEIDACSLLQASEISAAIGLRTADGIRRDEGHVAQGAYSSACVWTVQPQGGDTRDPRAPLGGRSFVIVNAMQWPIGSGLSGTFLEAFRKAAEHGEIPSKPVAKKFGDEALWWGDGLAIRQGDVSVGISVFVRSLKPARPGQFEERLAPHVLRRLSSTTK